MAEVGKPLFPWQREILRDIFGRRADGSFASFEAGLFVARQNGKGVIIEAMELYALYMLREEQIVHSAHLFSTSQKSFLRLKALIEGSDWLRKRTMKPRESHGHEGFTLTPAMGGGMLDYKARTKHSARGFTGNRIVLDEAYSLQAPDMSAMTPTLLSIPNAQLCYFSSPPDDETGPLPENAFLPSVRKRGKAGKGRITYWEWSPAKDADLAAPETHAATNPSYGYLISPEAVSDQYVIYEAADRLDKFATEMCGAWPDDEAAQWQVVSEKRWTAATAAEPVDHDPLVLALNVTPDRRSSCLGVAGGRPDGDVGAGVVVNAAGTDWVVSRTVAEVGRLGPCRLVINAAGAATSLIPEIEKALAEADLAVEVVTPNAREEAAAYGMVYDALTRPDNPERPWRLWHNGDEALTRAVAAAETRPVGAEGTTWAWNEYAAPLKSVTHAVWGFVTRPVLAGVEALVEWR